MNPIRTLFRIAFIQDIYSLIKVLYTGVIRDYTPSNIKLIQVFFLFTL